MKRIKLTKGKYTLVDDDMYDYLNQWKWYFNDGYAERNGKMTNYKKSPHVSMHRVVNNTPEGFDTDHIDRNPLNNQKINLRTATRSQNLINTNLRNDNTSGVKGVTWDEAKKKWLAQIGIDNKIIFLGRYFTIEKAKSVRKNAEKLYFGTNELCNALYV